MSWEEVSIGDYCQILSSKRIFASDYVNNGVPFYRSKEIIHKALNEFEGDEVFIKEERFKEIKDKFGAPEKGDVLISAVGNRSGICYWVKDEYDFYFKDGNLIWFRNFTESLLSKHLVYLLNSDIGQAKINNIFIGAAQKALTIEAVKKIKILLPPLETQKRIASILSIYDDLTENNLKRIKLLEETAQNIYKEWFVNFRFPNYEHTEFDAGGGLPVGWSVDIIGNQLLTIKRNGKLKTDDYEVEGKFPIIDQGNGFIAGYTNNEEVVQDSYLPIVVFGDHTRRVKFVNFPFVSGADGTQLMFPKNKNLLPAYFYLSINNIDLSNYAYARHYKFMKEQSILIPDEKTLDEFNKKTYPLLEQIIHLLNYNQKLKEARDILLPRLMNRTIEI